MEQAGHLVGDDLGDPFHVGSDHGRSLRHGLHDDQSEPFEVGRQHRHVEAAQQLRDIVSKPGKHDVAGHSPLLHELGEHPVVLSSRLGVRVVPNHEKPHGRIDRDDTGRRPDEGHVILLRSQPPDHAHDLCVRGHRELSQEALATGTAVVGAYLDAIVDDRPPRGGYRVPERVPGVTGHENEPIYGPEKGPIVPSDVWVRVPYVAEHGQASKLRGGGCAKPGHEVRAMHQGDPLATQLPRQPNGSPEKWTGLSVAQIDGAERGGLKSGTAKE